jgi:MFS family permease
VTAFVGTAAFVAAAPSDGPADDSDGDLLGPLREPAIRTIVLLQVPVGIAFGCIQVTLPAFAEQQRHAAYAGVLLALFSLASIVGALLYGARPRRRPLQEVHQRLAMLLPLGFLPALGAWSIPAMALLAMPAGAVVAALIAIRNEIASISAPTGTATEAVTWPLTALLAGTALGSAIAGVAVDGPGWRAAVAVSVLATSLSAVHVRIRGAALAYATAP